jgi:hypothetical protein
VYYKQGQHSLPYDTSDNGFINAGWSKVVGGVTYGSDKSIDSSLLAPDPGGYGYTLVAAARGNANYHDGISALVRARYHTIINLSEVSPVRLGGIGWEYNNKQYEIKGGANVTITGSTTYVHRVVVQSGTTTITLDGAMIDRPSQPDAAALRLDSGANLTLTLKAGTSSSLVAGSGYAGIRVPPGAALTINGTGELTAQASGGAYIGAGIGGASHETNGDITITSGTVNAITNQGAGIGGGFDAAGGNITISGGTVTATSGNGEGIGAGRAYATSVTGANLVIMGGTITAYSSNRSALASTVSFDSSGGLTGYNYTTSPNFNGSGATGPIYTSDLSAWSDFSSKYVKIECNP